MVNSQNNNSEISNGEPISLDNVENAMNKVEGTHSQMSTNKPWTFLSLNRDQWFRLMVGSSLTWLLFVSCWYIASTIEGRMNRDWECVHINPYPGYTGDIHIGGEVCIDRSGVGNIYRHRIKGLDRSSSGGWHVHDGTSCDKSGGHYQGDLSYDPWVNSYWNSNRWGKDWDTHYMSNIALNVDGRTLVFHSHDGHRIGCGEIPGTPIKTQYSSG